MSLLSRFLAAETQFLSAFAAGPEAISAFDKSWSSLYTDYATAVRLCQVDAQISTLAHTVASRIGALAHHLLDLDREAELALQTLTTRFEDILLQSETSDPPTENTSVPRFLDYVAHSWLLQNIHDPYPSATVKEDISSRCQCSVKEVQRWFAEVRRRIGWTALSGEKFGGSRQATSHAAQSAYFNGGLDITPSTLHAFATIKSNVHALYPDVSPSHGCGGITALEDSHSRAQDSYGDDEAKLELDAGGDTSWFEAEEDTTPPPPVAGFKRRSDVSLDLVEGLEEATTSVHVRPAKRYRRASAFTCEDAMDMGRQVAACPSHSAITPAKLKNTPSAMTMPSSDAALPSTLTLTPVPADDANADIGLVPTSRKRRLSDPQSPTSLKLKWPRDLMVRPRRHAVSVPLHFGSNVNTLEDIQVDEWLRSLIDIPSCVGGNQQIPASPNVDLFTFDTLVSGSSEDIPSLTSNLVVSDADLVSATPEGFDFSGFGVLDSMTSPADFEAGSDNVVSDSFSTPSTPSSAAYSLPELSDFGLVGELPYLGWNPECRNFEDVLGAWASSPTSSLEPSLSLTSDAAISPSQTDISRTLFGVNPSFTTDLLSDIGQLPSLSLPLEASF